MNSLACKICSDPRTDCLVFSKVKLIGPSQIFLLIGENVKVAKKKKKSEEKNVTLCIHVSHSDILPRYSSFSQHLTKKNLVFFFFLNCLKIAMNLVPVFVKFCFFSNLRGYMLCVIYIIVHIL